MSKVNVMIDLETLGLLPSSIICSIGAVAFDLDQGIYTDKDFYYELDVHSQPRSVDMKTIVWWMSQGNAPVKGEVRIDFVLSKLREWMIEICGGRTKDLFVWANGTDFDISVLKDVHRMFGIEPIWKYNAVRDYRTISKVFDFYSKTGLVNTKPHNALEDARYQAAQLLKILKSLENLGVEVNV